MRSPLAQGRGLKHSQAWIKWLGVRVAPRAGAWIETRHGEQVRRPDLVAPRAGAWIETGCLSYGMEPSMRRPSRRGVD